MRILVIQPTVFQSQGGIQRFNRLLCKAVSEFCALKKSRGKCLSLYDNPNVNSKYIDVNSIDFRGFNGFKVAFVMEVLKACFGADLLIIGHVNLAPLGLAAKLIFGKPYLVVTHGIEVWNRLPLVKRISLRKADLILSVSAYTKNKVNVIQGIPKGRIALFPMALDPYWCHERQRRDGLELPRKSQRSMILSVSRLEVSEGYKGVDHIMMALPSIIRKFPDVYHVIVGSGDDVTRLESLSRSLKIEYHVSFVGTISDSDLIRYYERCEIFALPSKREGFGTVFLEAMFFGRPIIAANSGAVPEIVEHCKTGLLVEYGDVKSIGESICRLLSNPSLSRKMGKTGHMKVEDKYTYPHLRDNLFQLLANWWE